MYNPCVCVRAYFFLFVYLFAWFSVVSVCVCVFKCLVPTPHVDDQQKPPAPPKKRNVQTSSLCFFILFGCYCGCLWIGLRRCRANSSDWSFGILFYFFIKWAPHFYVCSKTLQQRRRTLLAKQKYWFYGLNKKKNARGRETMLKLLLLLPPPLPTRSCGGE